MKTEFCDDKIGIRPYRPEDIPLLFEAPLEFINEVFPWMPWCHPDYSMQDSIAWAQSRQPEWDKGENYSFVVYDLNSNQFLGGVGLNFINRVHQFATLGYWVRSSRT